MIRQPLRGMRRRCTCWRMLCGIWQRRRTECGRSVGGYFSAPASSKKTCTSGQVRSTRRMPASGPSTDSMVASPSERMPSGAMTVTAMAAGQGMPVRGSRTCEYRTPSITTNCTVSPEVDMAAFARWNVRSESGSVMRQACHVVFRGVRRAAFTGRCIARHNVSAEFDHRMREAMRP